MITESPATTSATYIERLQQAVRVMEGLSDIQRTHFDMCVFAVQCESGIRGCIAGLCGLDPWFQAQGFCTTVADAGGIGCVTIDPEAFFGTDHPFYRCRYSLVPLVRDVTVEDAISALRRAIDSFTDVPGNAEAATV